MKYYQYSPEYGIYHLSHSNKHTPKGSAICVQKFDVSQSSAIRITYRT